MKQILIPENLFNKILKGCKNTVAKDLCRPSLEFIRIEVHTQSITAYSLDGYRASRVTIPLREAAEEEFIAYIMPFAFKEIADGKANVLLGVDDDGAFVEFKTTYGKSRLSFAKPEDWTVKIEELFDNAGKHDREVGAQANCIVDACKSIKEVVKDRYNLVVVESSDNPVKPFILRGKGEDVTIDQLILPVKF